MDALVALCPGEQGAGLLAQLHADFKRLDIGVRQCAKDRDIAALAARSHEIKGLAATLGAGPLTSCATAVQDACDHVSAGALVDDLTELLLAEIGAVIAALTGLAGQDNLGPDGMAEGDAGSCDVERAEPGQSGLGKTEHS